MSSAVEAVTPFQDPSRKRRFVKIGGWIVGLIVLAALVVAGAAVSGSWLLVTIAAGLGARQLVLLTDVDGVRDADGHKLDSLTVAEADHLIESGVIGGGMVPKIRAALGALGWAGAEAIIADASALGALERALSDPTFGTRITARASVPA